MHKSAYNSKKIQKNHKQTIDGVTSLTVTNLGASNLVLMVNGEAWDLPLKEIGKTTQSRFVITPDFTQSQYILEFVFEGGAGEAILAYKKLIDC